MNLCTLTVKLAGARRERFAGHADDVAEIKFLEDLEIIFPDLVALNVNLHSAGRVFDIRENGFSHGAECRHAACDRDFLLLFRFRFEVLPDICGHLHIVEASSEGQNACGSEILNFCRALRENILGLLLGSILNVFLRSFSNILSKNLDKLYKIQPVRIFSMGKYHFNSPYRHTSGHGISASAKTGGDEKPGGYSI